jgi:hypothetical protein
LASRGAIAWRSDTLPLSGSAVRVASYLAGLNPGGDMTAVVDSIKRQAAQVESADLSPATEAGGLLFGWPASYWLDLRDYDQVGVDVTIRVYDADDHMFFAGAGKSAPADYERPRHVDAAVVADIAEWLPPGAGRGPSRGLSPVCGGRLR